MLGRPPQRRQLIDASPVPNEIDKLIQPHYVTQVGWLYPLALAGLLFEIWPLVKRKRRRGRALRSGAIGCTLALWLVTSVAVLSLAAVPHTAYLSALSVQVALLSASAVVRAVRLYRLRGRRERLLLPYLLALETGWSAVPLHASRLAPAWLLPTVLVAGLGASLALLITVVQAGQTRTRSSAMGDDGDRGRTGQRPDRAPRLNGLHPRSCPGRFGGRRLRRAGTGRLPATFGASGRTRLSDTAAVPGTTRSTIDVRPAALVQFLRQHDHRGDPLMVTDQWPTASPYILNAA